MTTFYVLSFLYLLGVFITAPAFAKVGAAKKTGAGMVILSIMLWPFTASFGFLWFGYGSSQVETK